MVKSIESYISETTKSYDPAIKALNNQISGLDTSKASDFANLERSYASQQEGLERQKNRAAETASLAAASRGGAFGGASNIARRNYYQDTFVPAVTQLNSNKASAEENINKNYNERRSNLESQLANLYTQANTIATQRYDDALKQDEAIRQYNEKLALQKARDAEAIRQYNLNLELQKQQLAESARQHAASIAAQNRATDVQARAQGYLGSGGGNGVWNFGNGYSVIGDDLGNAVYLKGNTQISADEFLRGAVTDAGHHYWDTWNDIWNKGISTVGVGSDTINDYYNRRNNGLMNNSAQVAYRTFAR